MADFPKSHYSFPASSSSPSASGSCPSYPGPSSDCSRPNAAPTPSDGNHPPPPPPPHSGGSSSNNARVDDIISITGGLTISSSTARKHNNNQTKTTESSTATSPLSPWKKQEIHLLNDILEFCNKYRTDPCNDSNSMHKFYKLWIKRRGFSEEDEDVLSKKMVELRQRFLINLHKLLSGGNIEDWMDPLEIKIYLLSYKIWGNDR